MMRSAAKIRASGIIGTVLLFAAIGTAIPVSQGYAVWMNEEVKDLEADVAQLNVTGAVAADYDVTYTYQDAEDEEHKVAITGAAISVGDGATVGVTNETWHEDLRVFSVDLSAVSLTTDPEYTDAGDYDHWITVEFPDTADILWEETIRSFCTGLVVESGHDDQANLVPDQSFRFVIGAGDATLHTVTLGEDSDHVVENGTDAGDASTEDIGECQDRDDLGDTDAEYEKKLSVEDIQGFLLDAYVEDDADDPEEFWFKIYGPRAVDGGNETGDLLDFAFQLYGYDDDQRTDYSDMGVVQLIFGGVAAGGALLMTAAFSVPTNDLRPNIKRERRL